MQNSSIITQKCNNRFFYCSEQFMRKLLCRLWKRALLDVRHGLGRRGSVLLDVYGSSHHLHQLERGRAEQLPVREWRGGELLGTVEQGRKRTQVERLAVLLRDVFRV